MERLCDGAGMARRVLVRWAIVASSAGSPLPTMEDGYQLHMVVVNHQ